MPSTPDVGATAPGPLASVPDVRHVPATGLPVFAAPDDETEPVGALEGGHEVTIVGRRGRWVHLRDGAGLDAWADGSTLAGIARGVASPAEVPASTRGAVELPAPMVVEKVRAPVRFGTGPIVGAIGGVVAIVGALLPWVQAKGRTVEADAFGIPMRFLSDWQNPAKGGFELGWLVVILAGVGIVVSLVSGGGTARRVLGLALVIVCAMYVLQWQDFLTSGERGLGTGLNVWDLVGYGVAVTFGGGVVMLFSPNR